MSEEQISTALGQIIGKLDALHGEFQTYRISHDVRHTGIDGKLEEHSAHMHQQRGAKAVLLAIAGIISAVVAYLVKKF